MKPEVVEVVEVIEVKLVLQLVDDSLLLLDDLTCRDLSVSRLQPPRQANSQLILMTLDPRGHGGVHRGSIVDHFPSLTIPGHEMSIL